MNILDRLTELQKEYKDLKKEVRLAGVDEQNIHLSTRELFSLFDSDDLEIVDFEREGDYPYEAATEYKGVKFMTLLTEEEYKLYFE